MGALHPNLEAVSCIEALKTALENTRRICPFILLHHSDRGIRYCSQNYTALLNKDGIAISMTQSGSLYVNALAERVNGIIKNEFFPKKIYQNHKEAKINIIIIIDHYNLRRPHSSLDYLTPNQGSSLNVVGKYKKADFCDLKLDTNARFFRRPSQVVTS